MLSGDENLTSLVVVADGREIYSSVNRSDAARKYEKILCGDPGDVGTPKWAHWFFGNCHHAYDQAVGSLLKNGSVNELDLRIVGSRAASDKVDIVACHLRSFTYTAQGTIRFANAY